MALSGLFSDARSRYAGMDVKIVGAQEQRRTACDVPGPWCIPGRVPSKKAGRKGTRRAYKHRHPPHRVWLYREPEDVLVLHDRTIIATPAQAAALRRATAEAAKIAFPQSSPFGPRPMYGDPGI